MDLSTKLSSAAVPRSGRLWVRRGAIVIAIAWWVFIALVMAFDEALRVAGFAHFVLLGAFIGRYGKKIWWENGGCHH